MPPYAVSYTSQLDDMGFFHLSFFLTQFIKPLLFRRHTRNTAGKNNDNNNNIAAIMLYNIANIYLL